MHSYTPAEPYGAWIAFQGREALVLAVIIAIAAILFAVAGTRLRQPIALKRPGSTIAGLVFVLWLLSMLMLFIALLVYGVQMKQVQLEFMQDKPQIGTIFYAVITMLIVAYLTRKSGWKIAWPSGFFAAAGAVMLFELPFDLIIMARVFPPLPPSPDLYRALFFCPLFMWEVSTLALLAMSPCLRITRGTCYALAGMFAVWVVWAAAFGFAYPVTPGPLAVNVVSKILAFVAAVLLFVWREPQTPEALPAKAS